MQLKAALSCSIPSRNKMGDIANGGATNKTTFNFVHRFHYSVVTRQALGLGLVAYEQLLPLKVSWLISISEFGSHRSEILAHPCTT